MEHHAPGPAQAYVNRPGSAPAFLGWTSIMRLPELKRGCDPSTKSAIVADNV